MSDRSNIDWEQVRAQLAARNEATTDDAADTEREERTMRRRARELAKRRTVADDTQRASRPALVFKLGEERYCIDVARLVEILPFSQCTPLPGGPPELLGVMNVRGEIRSVVDLARLMNLPVNEASDAPSGYVVLVRRGEHEVGLRVDHVEKIDVLPIEETSASDGAASDDSGVHVQRSAGGAILMKIDQLLRNIPGFERERKHP